ncbi:hypothetical protein CH373_09815 [Leptospira perolatii]|uniref:Autotransporter domain-containing protein n=1 Tax=Leptospira perolatii TaxID=2023191 RepID=A0A2M9ZMQ4_9LEPT|nr:hypothetical protein [Leptospira perolatii]PJZ70081.1 hypothetical protein CH360_07560 [Leptospira perolatii]PJZ73269.1 hypothetical protein CH373_09815 [Leptospira perolatii]
MDVMALHKNFTKRYLSSAAVLIGTLLAYVAPGQLEAQIFCTPPASGPSVCSVIPANVKNDFNGLEEAIRTQYLNEVTKSMAEASVLSNINASMMGPGIVNRFQVGAGISISGVQNDDITVKYKDTNIPKFPNVGFSLNPSFMAAVNLGWLTAQGQSDQEDSKRSFLHRLSLYVHGFQSDLNSGDLRALTRQSSKDIDLLGNINSFGATLRFQLIRERYTKADLFGFTGLSLGIGFHRKWEELNLIYHPGSATSISFGNAAGKWDGDVNFGYRSYVQSVPVDIRTGFRALYVLTVFAGLGVSNNTGNTKIHLERTGPLYLTVDPAAYNLPPQLIQMYSGGASGTLTIRTNGSAEVRSQTSYILGGIELNLFAFKLLVEAMASEKVYSGNIGVKFAL